MPHSPVGDVIAISLLSTSLGRMIIPIRQISKLRHRLSERWWKQNVDSHPTGIVNPTPQLHPFLPRVLPHLPLRVCLASSQLRLLVPLHLNTGRYPDDPILWISKLRLTPAKPLLQCHTARKWHMLSSTQGFLL